MKDYYELLEVNKNASEDTIKKVFRFLIKKNHPDLFEGEEKAEAEEKVKLLNEAYAILIDKEKREQYNRELEENNVDDNNALEILIEENEYLKKVIQEKDKMIKEYLQDIGVDVADFENNEELSYTDEGNENEYINVDKEGYNLYQIKQRIKNIIYMMLMILVGIIILKISTGVNVFEIITDIFKNMF